MTSKIPTLESNNPVAVAQVLAVFTNPKLVEQVPVVYCNGQYFFITQDALYCRVSEGNLLEQWNTKLPDTKELTDQQVYALLTSYEQPQFYANYNLFEAAIEAAVV